MKLQVNRLSADTGKSLAGHAIDRSKPLRFTVNGRIIAGYVGDTVLSALLASGVDTLGIHQGSTLGLRASSAPSLVHSHTASRPALALPMERTPATDGAEYQTLVSSSRPNFLSRLFQPGRTLGIALDANRIGLIRPWREMRGERDSPTDLLVIGGGVAGMAAALEGARRGLSVTLIERDAHLGGYSGLFGTQDGDTTPEENVATLRAEVAANGAVTVRTLCEAFAIGEGLVRVHELHISGGVETSVVDLPARFIVIATGSIERLPVFPGNRLPGVVGALEAFELASRYGVWAGQSWMLSTSTNPAYRLATLPADSGIKLDRILDGRDRASSRFIEFCKAYGIRQFPGTLPLNTEPMGGRLRIRLPYEESVAVDRFVVSGGWQPDLALWHMAGGESHWHSDRQRLEPVGSVKTLALAGAAAGYLTRRGCLTSGIDAVDRLLGRAGRGVDDPVIDPFYETPDAFPVGPQSDGVAVPSYLDADETLVLRLDVPRRKWSPLLNRKPERIRVLSEVSQPLSIAAIAAGVALGLIPAKSAGIVAHERVAMVPLLEAATEPVAEDIPAIPVYLAGRFGRDARVAILRHDTARNLDSGALLFEDEDTMDPRRAIGVVLRRANDITEVLIGAATAQDGRRLFVRDLGQIIPAEISLEKA